MMPIKLKVLLIGGEPEYVDLILRRLRLGGYDLEYRMVESEESLRGALVQSDWQVIISEYQAPRLNALEALRVLREQASDIPFIVVSSLAAEKVAMECMRSGAADFVPRNRLAQLPCHSRAKPREATERRARRHAESALRRIDASARKIVAASDEAILIVDRSGFVRYVNAAAERIFGQPATTLLGSRAPFRVEDSDDALEINLSLPSGALVSVEVKKAAVEWGGEESTVFFLHDVTLRKRIERQQRDSFMHLAETMSRAMASRDPYTTDHQQRVALLVVTIGSRMGLSDEQLWELRLGGLLHDVGKIAVPESLLTRPGPLTAEELDIARTHAQVGYDILKDSGLPPAVALMALHHHEKLDGSGYPQGLIGSSLGLADRILSACNVLEALTSFRPYRRAFSVEDALEQLIEHSDTWYDSSVTEQLSKLVAAGEYELKEL